MSIACGLTFPCSAATPNSSLIPSFVEDSVLHNYAEFLSPYIFQNHTFPVCLPLAVSRFFLSIIPRPIFTDVREWLPAVLAKHKESELCAVFLDRCRVLDLTLPETGINKLNVFVGLIRPEDFTTPLLFYLHTLHGRLPMGILISRFPDVSLLIFMELLLDPLNEIPSDALLKLIKRSRDPANQDVMEMVIPMLGRPLPRADVLGPGHLFSSPRLWAALFRHADRPTTGQDITLWIDLFAIVCQTTNMLVHDVFKTDVRYFAQSSHALNALRRTRAAQTRTEPLPLPGEWIKEILAIGEFVDAHLWQWFRPSDIAMAFQANSETRGLLFPAFAIHRLRPANLAVPSLTVEELESIMNLFTPWPALPASGLTPNAQLFIGTAAYCAIRGTLRKSEQVGNLSRQTIMLFLGFILASDVQLKRRLFFVTFSQIETLLAEFFTDWTGDRSDMVGFRWFLCAVSYLSEFLQAVAPRLVPILLPFIQSHTEFFAEDAVFRKELSGALAALSQLAIPFDDVAHARKILFEERSQEIWDLYLSYPQSDQDPHLLVVTANQISTALNSLDTAACVIRLLALGLASRDPEFLHDPQLFLNHMHALEAVNDRTAFAEIASFMASKDWTSHLVAALSQDIPFWAKLTITDKLTFSKDLLGLCGSERVLLPLLCPGRDVELTKEIVEQLNLFLTAVLTDENLSKNQSLLVLSPIRGRFCFTGDVLRSVCRSAQRVSHLSDAISKSFIQLIENRRTIIFVTPEPPALEPISDEVKSFIHILVTALCNDNHQWSLHYFLSRLTISHPYIFTGQDLTPLFTAVFDLSRAFVDCSKDPEGHVEDLLAIIAAHRLITAIVAFPANADAFLTWGFGHFDEFDLGQAAFFLYSLSIFTALSSSRLVLYAYFRKYMWVSVISRHYPGFVETKFGQEIIREHLRSVQAFLTQWRDMSDDLLVAIDALSRLPSPFQAAFCDEMTIFQSEPRPVDYHVFAGILIPADHRFSIVLTPNVPVSIGRPRGDDNPQSAASPIPFPVLPAPLTPEVVGALPHRLVATILHGQLPSLTINQEMRRFLVSRPVWAAYYITTDPKPELLLPIPHLLYLQDLFDKLSALATVPDIDLTELRAHYAEDAIQAFLNPVELFIPTSPVTVVLGQLARGSESALRCALTLIAAEVSTDDLPRTLELVQSLACICQTEGGTQTSNALFSRVFREIAANRVLAVVGSYRCRISQYFPAIFAAVIGLGEALPDSSVQLVNLFLVSRCGRKEAELGLSLAAQLPESLHAAIIPYVDAPFRQILDGRPDEIDCVSLQNILVGFKFLTSDHRQDLLALLRESFRNFSEPEFRLISTLIRLLAPKRREIRVSRGLDAQMREDSEVAVGASPEQTCAEDQDFWEIITEFHGLISNLLRKNSDLIDSDFRFLLDRPELLSLPDKMNYFRKSQLGKVKDVQKFRLQIHREQAVGDTFMQCHSVSDEQFLRPLWISFVGEAGIDLGGLMREWFTIVINGLFDPRYGLFTKSPNQQTYQLNPLSYHISSYIDYCRLAGRMIGRAIIEKIHIEPHLSSVFLKQLLGHPVTLCDMEQIDSELHSSLLWMLNNSFAVMGLPDLTFSVNVDEAGVPKVINLIENGSQISVTDENKKRYVSLTVEYYLRGQISTQLDAFCDGFYGMVPLEEIRFFSPSELDLLLCGVPEIDVADFQANCGFATPYDANHPVIIRFFKVISKWDNTKLAKLLIFVTGSSQVPVGGFAAFQQTGHQISIAPGGTTERLPEAHTCFNQLDLPAYENESELEAKLAYAISECVEFGLA
jgi:E3 ubiquitin-protein ligase HUWE1